MKTPGLRNLGIAALCCAVCLASASALAQSDDLALAKSKLIADDNAFAFDLMKEIATEEPTTNVFISPFSVSTAMQMVSEGAAGWTESEIRGALRTGDLPAATLNAAWKNFYDSLNSQSNEVVESVGGNWYVRYILRTNSIFNLADGMWYQKDFQLKPQFAAVIRDSFRAELAPVNFEDPSTAALINDWSSKQTYGRIDNIVSFPFPAQTALILANAIYYKGKWGEPFEKSKTKPRDFYLPDGTAKQVPMMSRYGTFSYEQGDGFQAVQLPYEDGLQMTIYLPDGHTSPRQLLQARGSLYWPEIVSGFPSQDGTLILPKFKFDYDILLNGPLQKLGIKRAFDPGAADFSSMGNGSLYITKVQQKSFVAVDEEGTEAAAVTAVLMSREAQNASPPKPFEMIVNRPFLFLISVPGPWPNLTPVILFMGIVNDPAGTQ